MPPKASETSLRDFAHSVLQESESVFVLTPWASGWLVHESGFELISREVRPALTQTGVSTRSPVQGLSRAELRESQTLSTHSLRVSVPTVPRPTHPMASNIKSVGPQSRHVSAVLSFPADFPLDLPVRAPPSSFTSGFKTSSEKSILTAVGLPRECWRLAEPLSPCGDCHLFLASSAAYDFHTEKSINSSSKD